MKVKIMAISLSIAFLVFNISYVYAHSEYSLRVPSSLQQRNFKNRVDVALASNTTTNHFVSGPFTRREMAGIVAMSVLGIGAQPPKQALIKQLRAVCKILGYPTSVISPFSDKKINNLEMSLSERESAISSLFLEVSKSIPRMGKISLDIDKISELMAYLFSFIGYQGNGEIYKLLELSRYIKNIAVVPKEGEISLQQPIDEFVTYLYNSFCVAAFCYGLLGAIKMPMAEFAIAPEHAFTVVERGDNRNILFIDFISQVVRNIDLSEYYDKEKEYYVLKKQYRINPFNGIPIHRKLAGILIEYKNTGDPRFIWDFKGSEEERLLLVLNAFYPFFQITNKNGCVANLLVNMGAFCSRYPIVIKPAGNELEFYDLADKLNPISAKTCYNRGIILEEVAKNEEKPDRKANARDKARSEYQKAIGLNPGDYNSLAHLAQMELDDYTTIRKRGALDRAILLYNQAIEAYPCYAEAWFNLGYAYMLSGNIELATEDFARAIFLEGIYQNNISRLPEAIKLVIQKKLDGLGPSLVRPMLSSLSSDRRAFIGSLFPISVARSL